MVILWILWMCVNVIYYGLRHPIRFGLPWFPDHDMKVSRDLAPRRHFLSIIQTHQLICRMHNLLGAALTFSHRDVFNNAAWRDEKFFYFGKPIFVITPKFIYGLPRVSKRHEFTTCASKFENQLLLARCQILKFINYYMAISLVSEITAMQFIQKKSGEVTNELCVMPR